MRIPWAKIVAFPVMAACLAMTGIVLVRGESPPEHPWQPPPQYLAKLAAATTAPATPKAVFLGDSYTGGAAGVKADDTFAGLTCQAMRWACTNLGWGGTGYVAGEAAHHDYASRIPSVPDPAITYVIVSGGRNDTAKDYSDTEKNDGIQAVLAALPAAYPNATIFVVEPFWVDEHPTPELRQVRAFTRDGARRIHAKWIESSDWLDFELIARDGVHPTPKGHRVIAKHLEASLRQSTSL